jgi:hypothetical protein
MSWMTILMTTWMSTSGRYVANKKELLKQFVDNSDILKMSYKDLNALRDCVTLALIEQMCVEHGAAMRDVFREQKEKP